MEVTKPKTDMVRYYEDSILISEIGSDNGLAAATVRIINYIHARCMNGNGIGYFSTPDRSDIEDIKKELGIDMDLSEGVRKINSKSCRNREREDIISDILIEAYSGNDAKSDMFRDNLCRLNLYIDEGFRNEKFRIYARIAASLPVFRKGAEPLGVY
jgi:hypothetical protein